MLAIDVISRVLHVLTAITLVGGSIFTLLILMPSAKELADDAHEKLASAVMGRWKRFVHFGILIFLVTGFYNYIRAIPLHKGDGLYHAFIGTKMLLAVCVFFLAAAIVGRSPKLQGIRDNKQKWLRVLVLIALLIVGISGFAKVRGVPDSSAAKTPVVANE